MTVSERRMIALLEQILAELRTQTALSGDENVDFCDEFQAPGNDIKEYSGPLPAEQNQTATGNF